MVSRVYLTSSASLCLGLPVGPANAPALRCDCGTTVLPGDSDHPLACTCLALQRTPRHDFVTTSWRRIAARAGVHTTAEPPFCFFPTPSSPPANPSARPALASFLGGFVFYPPVLVDPTPPRWLRRSLWDAWRSSPPSDPGAPFCCPDPQGVPPSPQTRGRGGHHVCLSAPACGGRFRHPPGGCVLSCGRCAHPQVCSCCPRRLQAARVSVDTHAVAV
jgi:hypothetical protein